jgi:Uma2 family endonuclease
MTVKQRLTAEELWSMPDVPGKRFELVEGELIEMPGAGMVHALMVGLLYRLIETYSREHRLGVAFTDGLGYIIAHDSDIVRIPDVSLVSRGRLPREGIVRSFCPVPPDLAVEIVSPTDRFSDVQAKVREYLAAGTRLVWVVWPEGRSVIVHRADGVAELGSEGVLSGGDVLPGFEVRVGQLFEQEI